MSEDCVLNAKEYQAVNVILSTILECVCAPTTYLSIR